jgi:plasmid stabilization system protein ParE
MSHSVVFAPEVSDQLETLFLYVAERSSPAIAERLTRAVVTTCEGLALFPLRGVAREDIRPGLRLTHHKGRTVIAYAAHGHHRGQVYPVSNLVGDRVSNQTSHPQRTDPNEPRPGTCRRAVRTSRALVMDVADDPPAADAVIPVAA